MLPTIIVTIIIAIIFVSIVLKGIYNTRKGKCSCSCGCSGCGMKDVCHPKG